MFSCMRGGHLSGFVVGAVVGEVAVGLLSCMRGGYLSGFVVGAVVGYVVVDDVELHERWLSLQCFCWFCG